MKTGVAFLILFCLYNITSAQQAIPATTGFRITVKVADSSSLIPIEYATITLADSSGKPVNGGITDKKGMLLLQKISPGNYLLKIGFIGYSQFSKKIFLNGDIKLDNILLSKKSSLLSNVTITSTQRAIENRIDKLVYNVDKDITSQGGVATDALKKIPMVTVDADGNVELLGNPSILFLINGKPPIFQPTPEKYL